MVRKMTGMWLVCALLFVMGCDQSKQPDAVSKLSPEQKRRAEQAKSKDKVAKKKEAPKRKTITLDAKIEEPKDKLGPGTEQQIKLLTQAKKFYLNNQVAKSEPYFKSLAESRPLSGPVVSATIALGDIYATTDRAKEAIALYKSLLKEDSTIAEVYLVVARAYSRLNHVDDAVIAYEKALRIQPFMVFIYPELAQMYAKAGKKEASAKAYLEYERKVYGMAKQLESVGKLNVQQRLNIIDAFSFLDDDRVIQALVHALQKDDNHVVRAGAATALSELQAAAAKPAMEAAMVTEKDHEARKVIKAALKKMAHLKVPPPEPAPEVGKPSAKDSKAPAKASPKSTKATKKTPKK